MAGQIAAQYGPQQMQAGAQPGWAMNYPPNQLQAGYPQAMSGLQTQTPNMANNWIQESYQPDWAKAYGPNQLQSAYRQDTVNMNLPGMSPFWKDVFYNMGRYGGGPTAWMPGPTAKLGAGGGGYPMGYRPPQDYWNPPGPRGQSGPYSPQDERQWAMDRDTNEQFQGVTKGYESRLLYGIDPSTEPGGQAGYGDGWGGYSFPGGGGGYSAPSYSSGGAGRGYGYRQPAQSWYQNMLNWKIG